MIARKQEISLQLNQLIDALLPGGVFWLCHFLRSSKLVSSNPLLEIEIVDLEHLGTEALVGAIHRNNVGRVILTFSHIELDKVAAHEPRRIALTRQCPPRRYEPRGLKTTSTKRRNNSHGIGGCR